MLKPFGFSKSEHHAMLCHDWLTPRHVTIGTKAGKILLLEDAELKQQVDIPTLIDQVWTLTKFYSSLIFLFCCCVATPSSMCYAVLFGCGRLSLYLSHHSLLLEDL